MLFVAVVFSQDGDCVVDSGVELVPGPSPDPNFTGFSTYPSETTVQMCYTVEEYNTPGTQNWMHGVVPLFGPGWDLSSLQPIGYASSEPLYLCDEIHLKSSAGHRTWGRDFAYAEAARGPFPNARSACTCGGRSQRADRTLVVYGTISTGQE